MKSPSILIVGPRLDIGGTEMHLTRVLPKLKEAGVDVSVFALERGGALEGELAAAGIPIYGSERVMPRLPHTVTTLFKLARHLRETQPDLVHGFLPRPYLVALFACRLAGQSRCIMSRRSLSDYKRGHQILSILERVAHHRTQAFIGNSNAVVSQLLEEVGAPERVGLIHNGVLPPSQNNMEGRLAARSVLGLSEDALVICIVASLFKYKGHADLLVALGRVRNQLHVPWRLIVIGRDEGIGTELARLTAAEAITDNVVWLGERSDVDFLLQAADIAVLASHEEGFSNSLLETMAHGIPTIATAVGGNLDAIVDGETGLLVRPASPDDLGRAIVRLAGDPSLRDQLGSAGRTRVLDRFSLAACVSSYERLYRNFDKIGDVALPTILDSVPLVSEVVAAPMLATRKLGSAPRIGYAPYAPSFNKPGDRRRFVAYARARNLEFEIADPAERYDIVVLTETADISIWPDYQRGKIVYDLIDSYLSVPRTDLAQFLRGSAWFMLGKHRKLKPDYLSSLRQMCRRADAVVCSTAEQSRIIGTYCGNVHIVLDIHEMVVRNFKTDYSLSDPIRLAWEGLPSNLPQLAQIAPVIAKLSERRALELHVVTDPSRERLKGLFGEVDSRRFLGRHFSNFVFHDWDERTCARIITNCDAALIPIDLADPLVSGKPENKLLLLWRMCVPVIAAATPAYVRSMSQVGTPQLACASHDEWLSGLEYLFSSEDVRRDAATRGQAYAQSECGPEVMLCRWDAVFSSVGYDFSGVRSSDLISVGDGM